MVAGRGRQSPSLDVPWAGGLERVQRTHDAQGAFVEHMGVDHGRADIGVAEQLLYGANVLPALQQVRGKATIPLLPVALLFAFQLSVSYNLAKTCCILCKGALSA